VSDETPTPGQQRASIPTIAGYPDAEEVSVPHQGNEYICPSCERAIPTRKQIRLAKPAKYQGALWDVLKCPYCNFLFAPKDRAIVIRE
jgi:DNA-directed RNA polymerase subunit RPC12/RpoP